MQQVTAHITVIAKGTAQASTKGADPATGASAGKQDLPDVAGFAHLLATQIGLKPTVAGVAAAPTDPTKALVDKAKSLISDDAEGDKSARDALIQQALDTAATLPLPQLIAQLKHDPSGRCCAHEADSGRDKKLPLELQSLVKAQGAQEPTLAAAAAKPEVEAAKFAGVQQAVETETRVLSPHRGDEAKLAADAVVTTTAPVAPRTEAITAPPQAQVRVDVPVGEKGWDQAVAQRVLWLANNNQQTAQLHVTPPNLGPVEIRITITNDQANAMFVSPHAGVREALESALPRLREMFADSGLTLGNVNVASEQQRQQAEQQHGHGRRRGGAPAETEISGVEGVGGGLRQGVASIRTGADGLVDIFA